VSRDHNFPASKIAPGRGSQEADTQRRYGSGANAKHSSVVSNVDQSYVQELCGDKTEAGLVVEKNRAGKVGAIEARFYVKTIGLESAAKPQPEHAVWVNR
jgi:hypothetical protein